MYMNNVSVLKLCSYYGSTNYVNTENTDALTDNKRKQWSSCHTLAADSNQPMSLQNYSNQPTTSQGQFSQPIGKLQKMNTDGTQVIKLTKPDNGPIGFYIAKGNAKYRNG